MIFRAHIWVVVSALMVGACTKQPRGELVIVVPHGLGYGLSETLPHPTNPPKASDFDVEIPRLVLLADSFWGVELGSKLRDVALTNSELGRWRDTHVSIKSGTAAFSPNGEFVCNYLVEFNNLDAETASRVFMLMAEAYRVRFTYPPEHYQTIAKSLISSIAKESAALDRTTKGTREHAAHSEELAWLKKELGEAESVIRGNRNPIKSARML